MRWQVKTVKKQKLPSEKQGFHLIRPVCALGTFPSRGRLEKALFFLTLLFVDRLAASGALTCPGFFADFIKENIEKKRQI